ncbi:TPA: polysaccharide pyruvyl transferase family protein [Proteus mirabilis]|uniref:Polysaccharide pyruvyl transferase domain-containing protein n=1 Tax=Proteus mirabilis TaxID=584 RepID=A0A385JNF6_PROMI|nr:hypothetical protein [Proteus mirabilis]HEK0791921.1 polysaccharide pyruvyl transferase family protein [Proteus mirabilis]
MINSIALYDPSIATSNVGDEIISESVKNALTDIFNYSQIITFPTHSRRSLNIIKKANSCDLSFVGGSNLLSPKMLRYQQFKLSIYDFIKTKNLITLGVGWQYYQDKIDFLAQYFYRNNLSKDYILSVRDDYTMERLNSIGIKNIINTGCPTMWKLTEEHCKKIEQHKKQNVIFTLTDYSQNYELDRKLIEILKRNYKNIYFWPQGLKDMEYLSNLTNLNNINIVPPRLKNYNDFLLNNECDYIGTRLHGGIKALQNFHRTFIIGIDNRANEKQKDFNLLVLKRKDINQLDDLINQNHEMKITIKNENINKFKSQFII